MNHERYSRDAALEARRRERRRRRTAAVLSVALAGVLLVGGSLAYIVTKSGDVENAFTPGSVSCVVEEAMSSDGKTKSDVYVRNTGNVDAYIRAEVVVSWVKADDDTLGRKGDVLGIEPVAGTDYVIAAGEEGWSVEQADGFYYYTKKVSGGGFTTDLVPSCEVRKDAPADGYVLQVDVLASAIQADGTKDGKSVVEEEWGVAVAGDGTLLVAAAARN